MSPVATLERSSRDRRIAGSSPLDELEPMLVKPLSRELRPPSAHPSTRRSPRHPRPDESLRDRGRAPVREPRLDARIEDDFAAESFARAWPAVSGGTGAADALDFNPVLVQALRDVAAVPARRAAKRFQARPGVLRAAAYLVAGAATIAFAGHIAAAAAAPVIATHRTGVEIQSFERELSAATQHNDGLRAQIALMDTRTGWEQEARRRGWVKRDEVAVGLVFHDASGTAVKSARGPEIASRGESFADRIRQAVESTLAVFGGQSQGMR